MEFVWSTEEPDPALREKAFWEDVAAQMGAYMDAHPSLQRQLEAGVVLQVSIQQARNGSRHVAILGL